MKNKTIEKQQRILHSAFDIQTHKETFINYLEVVITYDGVIHYAVPSHDQFLINYLINDVHMFENVEDIYDYSIKHNIDLEIIAKSCQVWTDHVRGYVNDAILASLKKLIDAGLLILK